MDATNFTNSSNDKQGAATMEVSSESDNKVKIDSYWSKIMVDKLQRLGNSMELLLDDDSIPDLESISGSEELVIFVLTPKNLMSTTGSEKKSPKGSIVLFTDEEITELAIDIGEDGLTTFDATMLINIDGFNEGAQTKLYDSGALHHMLPYCDHFKKYMSITPKSTTAIDRQYFQAIGKGDLQIIIPNNLGTTTMLLKDVLHCPDMGPTLISIGKIMAAGYKVIFRGPTCRIYNCKDKVIEQINTRNGLYFVDHEIMVNATMSGQAWEVLTIKEVHCCMGHIAPETIKHNKGFEGINVELATMIQPCDSCEYAKTTWKPIKKVCKTPRAAKFGDKIHLDIWGPLPIQTPGHKEYYVSLTDDSTRWTHLQLLATVK